MCDKKNVTVGVGTKPSGVKVIKGFLCIVDGVAYFFLLRRIHN